jgi:HPt (histidine-containing phosphotransfer) domain-containing protein
LRYIKPKNQTNNREKNFMSVIDLNTINDLKETMGADYIAELIDVFLDDAPKLFAQMRTAAANKDVDSFRRAAHSMKSNAATFGATELSVLARDLETMGRENNLAIGNRLEVMEDAFLQVKNQLKALK